MDAVKDFRLGWGSLETLKIFCVGNGPRNVCEAHSRDKDRKAAVRAGSEVVYC